MMIAGITTEGGSWMAKALHPSDNIPKFGGVPTRDSVPTAVVNYTNTYILEAPTTTVDVWDCLISSVLTPVSFGKAVKFCKNEARTFVENVEKEVLLNTQLGVQSEGEPAKYVTGVATWRNMVTRYRPMYCGVTFTLTAPSTADQGTVAAVQLPLDTIQAGSTTIGDPLPGTRPMQTYRTLHGALDMGFNCDTADGTHYNPEFEFAALQGTPGAYVAAAKEGAYLVMKLDEEALQYKSSNELIVPFTFVGGDNPTRAVMSIYTDSGDGYMPFYSEYFPTHPYLPDDQQVLYVPVIVDGGNGSQATKKVGVPATDFIMPNRASQPESSKMMGLTYFRGISKAATITVTTRVGFECVVPPDSILLPSVEKAVAYDPVALDGYWRISKELAMAYPASYNFLGALWGVIKTIGMAVIPGLLVKGATALADRVGGNDVSEDVNYYRSRPNKPTPTMGGMIVPPAPAPRVRTKEVIKYIQRPAPSKKKGKKKKKRDRD